MASIEVRELGRSFGDRIAVREVSFTVAPGELFGIVGPDGAGKTTTLRMLAGVLRPSRGSAALEGVDVVADPEGVKGTIAYMPQQFGLYEDLTVRENLDFYADLHSVPRGERPERIERLHTFSGLGEFEDRLAGNLSGGMKQKLSLSCSLIHEPSVLLLDEPTFGVDPISRRELWAIVEERVAAGTTVLISTSYMDEAERCDRVALLHEGRILALDRPDRLRGRLGGRVWSVRAREPRRARDLLRGVAGVEGAALFGDRLHLTLREGMSWEDVEAALGGELSSIVSAEPTSPSLEDVFLHLVEGWEPREPEGP